MGCATSKDAASDAPPECNTRPYRRERLGPKAPTLAPTTPAHRDTDADTSSDASPDALNEREKARAVRRARLAHQLAEQQRIEQLRRARYLESFDALDNLAVSRLLVRQRRRPSMGSSASPTATLHDGASFDATSGDLPGAVTEEERALSMSQQLLSSAPSLQHPLSSAPSVYDLLRSQSSDGEDDDEGADAIRHVAVTEEDDGAEDLQSEAATATCYDVDSGRLPCIPLARSEASLSGRLSRRSSSNHRRGDSSSPAVSFHRRRHGCPLQSLSAKLIPHPAMPFSTDGAGCSW